VGGEQGQAPVEKLLAVTDSPAAARQPAAGLRRRLL